MSWKCPQDANEIPDGIYICPLCGFVKFPRGVIFKSDVTGKEMCLRLPGVLGHASLKVLGDEDVKYVDVEQFKLEKREDRGGWCLVPATYARNPLYLNGAAIAPEGVLLKAGDRLSIKDKFFRLTVRLLEE